MQIHIDICRYGFLNPFKKDEKTNQKESCCNEKKSYSN